MSINFNDNNEICLCVHMCVCVVLCVMNSQATGADSTSWSVKDTTDTTCAGRTGGPTVRLLRSSPSVGSGINSADLP